MEYMLLNCRIVYYCRIRCAHPHLSYRVNVQHIEHQCTYTSSFCSDVSVSFVASFAYPPVALSWLPSKRICRRQKSNEQTKICPEKNKITELASTHDSLELWRSGCQATEHFLKYCPHFKKQTETADVCGDNRLWGSADGLSRRSTRPQRQDYGSGAASSNVEEGGEKLGLSLEGLYS